MSDIKTNQSKYSNAQWITLEFLALTRSLSRFLRMTTILPMSVKGPLSQLKKAPFLARDGKVEVAVNRRDQKKLLL